ncbi:spondin-1-like [Tetranychus urticae]|uniref:spondin-1-like n=1 Tax=Tetranychus urticae TaxID=32264 RepID=UPI00077BFCE1|nr:spondin-1-like [Tetranychus urticae]
MTSIFQLLIDLLIIGILINVHQTKANVFPSQTRSRYGSTSKCRGGTHTRLGYNPDIPRMVPVTKGDTIFPASVRIPCNRRFPGSYMDKLPGDGGFKITIVDADHYYTPGKSYEVKLAGSQQFTLFQMVLENGGPPTDPDADIINPTLRDDVGRFMLYQDATTRYSDDCPNSVMHSANITKLNVRVSWRAPPSGSGCVLIKASIAVTPDIWFMDDGELTRRLCPDTSLSIDEQPEILGQCDACDEAKYQLLFKILWSKFTHPKNIPDKWLSYFSSLIGASHSNEYRMWEYDGYASKGLKQLAEDGNTELLKAEIRESASKMRTIIKGRALGLNDHRGQTFAIFRVDRENHLLSFISKLGPSPDWFVGVSAFELCLRNSSWLTERTMNLYLWDAGTASGDSYQSNPRPTMPPERIHAITSSWPGEEGKSPFYDPTGAKIKPFAQVTVKRLRTYPRTCDEIVKNNNKFSHNYSGDTEEPLITDNRPECSVTPWALMTCIGEPYESGEQIRNRSYINPVSAASMGCQNVLTDKIPCMPGCNGENICALSEWGPWSRCDTTCGRGKRNRRRYFIHHEAGSYCDSSMLVESEECHEWSDDCSTKEALGSSPEDPRCITTPWSEWSPCSVNCGLGTKYRKRFYVSARAAEFCSKELHQETNCNMGVKDCTPTSEETRPRPTDICLAPLRSEPCLTGMLAEPIRRWYYDNQSQLCLPFNFTGCEDISNNFKTKQDCEILCRQMLNSKGSVITN